MFISRKNYNLLLIYKNGITKWTCVNCVRNKSSAEPKTKTYSHTILTPKTNFPARSSNAIKEQIYETAQFSELYDWQRENLKGPEFVLHDGPPYANGDLHMGHAVNKIIKDINNRSQILQGNKVHYVPGWDCHGLPIELKALQKAKKSSKEDFTHPVNVRKIARSFALETVQKQKDAFRSWGVMADWESQCYLTLNKSYVQNQLRLFYNMYEKGYIYRALKPVYWSPSSKTALAEAELEYDTQYKSTEVYVAFDILKPPDVLSDKLNGKKISALVWTTTPWTLVANRAVCYNPQMKYSVVEPSTRPGDWFLVGSQLIQELETVLGVQIKKIVEFDGNQLVGATYKNSLVEGALPFLGGDHVTDAKGTGLVHTAPAHGPDDFLVALRNNMTVECKVDESGRYSGLDPGLDGLQVLGDGQEAVLTRLGDAVVHRGVYVHSYPLDWRTKQPVIIRASRQWFIDTARLKEKALAALDELEILPQSSSSKSRQGFRSQLEKRPYWCISRQRAWGVPVPALYSADDVIVDRSVVERLCDLLDRGPDVWWTCDVKELLTDDVIKKHNLAHKDISKGKDIMDIWLDSGLSWSTLGGKMANLYSEGVDQLTGWFQASLLTSLALHDVPPYKSIFVHGFVVDEKKRKMSKSIGNIIEPATIIHGGKDRHNHPAYGVDTLRWWAASHATQHSQIVISKNLLDDCQSEIIRVRNIMRYLLSVVNDVKRPDFHQKPTLSYFDRYMVQEVHAFTKQIFEHYDNFRYNHAAQYILYFISNKVSGLYCHCVKDRLYCSQKYSNERLSAQLVIHTTLVSLCKALGPILPHLIEEVWKYHPLYEKPFYFTIETPMLPVEKIDVSTMDAVFDIKKELCAMAKNENLKKFSATIHADTNLYDRLNDLNGMDGVNDSVLCEVLELSSVTLELSNDDSWRVELSPTDRGQCLRCRKYNVVGKNDKCLRCENVLSAL